jgi:hypothetical protein
MGVDYTITGTLAQFSREGIVRALAEQLTKQFADNLQARLPQAPAPVPSAAPAAVAASDADLCATAAAIGPAAALPPAAAHRPPAAAADTSSIDLWSLLKAWLRGLFVRPRA